MLTIPITRAETMIKGTALHCAIQAMRGSRMVGYLIPTLRGEWERSAVRPGRGQGFVVVDRYGEARFYLSGSGLNYRAIFCDGWRG